MSRIGSHAVRSASVVAGWLLVAFVLDSGVATLQTPPSFEVASIRKNQKGGGTGIDIPPGRFQATNAPLQFLIRWAYVTPVPRIVGGPDWIASERFDISATAPAEGWSTDRVRQMVRALLADRFGLVAHTETREVAIYTLMMVKPGAFAANLRPAAFNCAPGGPSRMAAGKVQCGLLVSGNAASASLRGGGVAMADFVRTLTEYAGRPVVDGTGLTERYDLELQFTADRSAVTGAPAPGGLTTNVDSDIAPLPTALREQLGLRLEAGRGPVELLVIDRATPPTEN
jgi:uncharacterized protein (TIGR03435 family)